MKKITATLVVLLCALICIGVVGCVRGSKEEAVEQVTEPTAEATVLPTATPEPTIDPAVFTDTDSLLIVANKKHRLPEGYEPADLVSVAEYGGRATIAPYMRQEAAEAFGEMTKAAEEDGVTLTISSAYRSESYQSTLYYGYVNQYGQEVADTISSRPGYSDHQTGLACDFIEGVAADFNEAFEDTASGQWLKENAHKYGFIMRYPKGKEEITGYSYEPWHFRYIGVEYATAIYETDEWYTFEEYFGVEGGDYED